MTVDDDIGFDNPEAIHKASFLSSDLWHEENAGSSSASDRHSMNSFTKQEKVSSMLKKKLHGKSQKSKYLSKNSPNKKTFKG